MWIVYPWGKAIRVIDSIVGNETSLYGMKKNSVIVTMKILYKREVISHVPDKLQKQNDYIQKQYSGVFFSVCGVLKFQTISVIYLSSSIIDYL